MSGRRLHTVMALVFVSRVISRRNGVFAFCSFGARRRQATIGSSSSTSFLDSTFSEQDAKYMDSAIQHAQNGLGHTFPNPAVGCVIVRQDDIIGQGFHPRAGFPHAEVFALLQASGHVDSGVEAASCIIKNDETNKLYKTVVDLTTKYASPDDTGPEELFGGVFHDIPVTAYVTLEPCCHFGKTPPCAASLVIAQVNRVVVGFRDPNPRVNGGGVQLLQEAGIAVDFATGEQALKCAQLVNNFVKRVSPREQVNMTGGMRRTLRSLAGRLKTEHSLDVKTWPSSAGSAVESSEQDLMDQVDELVLNPSWMEDVDACLWQKELVQLRLGNAVAKKKGAKLLGERIAKDLDAHVAQVVGHTVLLYRPGIPPVLNLEELSEQRSAAKNGD